MHIPTEMREPMRDLALRVYMAEWHNARLAERLTDAHAEIERLRGQKPQEAAEPSVMPGNPADYAARATASSGGPAAAGTWTPAAGNGTPREPMS